MLASRLYKSAKQFTESAVVAYDRGEAHVFLLHAGTALEHLLKARLAELNPLLIAKRDHVPSLVWFADETKHAVHPAEMRTITLDEAFNLAMAIKAPLGPFREDIGTLREYRNGVAHFGAYDHVVAAKVLPGFLNTLIALAKELGESSQDLFGIYEDFVQSQLAQHFADEERDYAGRLAQARIRFESEHGELDARTMAHLAQLVEMRWHPQSVEDQLIDCPACGLPAYAEGDLEQVDWDVDVDRDGTLMGAWPVLEYHPSVLRCPTCGLVLDTAGLISLSGAFENWHLSEADFDKYVREMREEEAYFRDYDHL